MSIEINNIIKRYDSHLAVDNINLTIEKGEIFGLLGPNGAGKSTTIKLIMSLLKLNSGQILVNGLDVQKESVKTKRLFGLVPQDIAVYEQMSVRENVAFFGRLYGLKGNELKSKVNRALEFTGLLDKYKDKPKKLSGGMKRRLNIACAIVHEPEYIIMDEPTVGIDPQSRYNILESVNTLNREGATIIYTSHYMEEVETLCSRVGIIDRGKLIALGNTEALKNQVAHEEKIVIEAVDTRYNTIEEMKKLTNVSNVVQNGNQLEIFTKHAQQVLQDVLYILSKENVQVRNIALQEVDLESVFLLLTGRHLRD